VPTAWHARQFLVPANFWSAKAALLNAKESKVTNNTRFISFPL
jgi:hypothetical protein